MLAHERVIVRILLAHIMVIVRIVLAHNKSDGQDSVGS
jgi:hypothetical protein